MGTLAADKGRFARAWQKSAQALAKLPAKPKRSAAEQARAAELLAAGREARAEFMRTHARAVYDSLTRKRTELVRLDALCERAAKAYPGLVPDARTLAREAGFLQSAKDGLEIDQGIFFSHILTDRDCGLHLCHAMLLPHPKTQSFLAEFVSKGKIALQGATVERKGKASVVTLRNPRFLNAEDETTIEGTEIAIDLALLDPGTEICVLRGGAVEHPKYAGQRLFGAGINLTHLYQGKIRYLWYLIRDFGFVNKIYRGLARPGVAPEEDSIEKLWIAAVNAYMTLPARKEGIIPGAANLRMARHVGDRVARQAILAERRLDCASPEGRLICDYIVKPADMDAEVDRLVGHIADSGMVSAAGNRRALRIGEEPLDAFRRYFSVYTREQAQCHFSPALISNLERNWDAKNRRI